MSFSTVVDRLYEVLDIGMVALSLQDIENLEIKSHPVLFVEIERKCQEKNYGAKISSFVRVKPNYKIQSDSHSSNQVLMIMMLLTHFLGLDNSIFKEPPQDHEASCLILQQ
jgi:hypothetical protein